MDVRRQVSRLSCFYMVLLKKNTTMNQKCPSCGNYVEGKKKATIGRKMTRGVMKKGGTTAAGALIGTMFGGPVGTVLGIAAGALMSDTTTQAADEMYDAAVGEIEYEFSCPKCGWKWTDKANSNEQVDSWRTDVYSSHEIDMNDEEVDWESKFQEDLDYFVENQDEIISIEKEVIDFINELDCNYSYCCDDIICSQYNFLQAFICLKYSVENWENNLFELCYRYINRAIEICDDNDEYNTLYAILNIANIKIDENCVKTFVELNNNRPDFDNDEYEFFTTESWKYIYNNVFVTVNNLIKDNIDIKKEDFYLDIDDAFEVKERGVVITGQVKTGCIEVGDKIILTNHDNSSKICQIIGIEMFKKLLDYCEFGDNVGLLLKGIDNMDEIRRGAFVEYYDGESPVGSYLQNSLETSSENEITSAEQKYLDELKACLEEDNEISPKERRLLERLREKLGITPERAKELEDSLSAPQLTDEEKEYLEEYKACVEDDIEISPKERRLLNRIRESLGISEERANEIETL